MDLVEALKEKQKERGDNQGEFAQYLGISQSALSRIYNEKRGVGSQVLAKILTRYSDLIPFFVQKNVDAGKVMAEHINTGNMAEYIEETNKIREGLLGGDN